MPQIATMMPMMAVLISRLEKNFPKIVPFYLLVDEYSEK